MTELLWGDLPVQKKPKRHGDENIASRLASLRYDYTNYKEPELIDAPPGYVALDFETEDPTLLERGSSWAFDGIGQVIGMAVAWEGFEAYYPIAHREGNVDRDKVIAWLTAHLKRPDIRIICANASYDLGWARRLCGLYPAGGVEDVFFAAALLDEYRFSYSLDSIAKDYLKVGKELGFLEELEKKWSLKHHQVMAHLKQLPGGAIAPYAATDARRTYDLRQKLLPLLEEQGLTTVYDLESALIPMCVEMRRRGIRVDVESAHKLSEDIKNRRMPELQAEIKRLTGVAVEPWESETLEAALKERGIDCERTRTGMARIDQEFLAHYAKTEAVAAHILDLRKMSKIQNTFLDGHILTHQHKGRIHGELNQLRSEREDGSSFGTVSGRLSSTNPNLQQLPARDKVWGPLIRGMFLAEDGEQIASLDYSSQEPRLIVHFAARAKLAGALEAVEKFKVNSRTDYHQMVAEIANIPRSQAKTINLGCFGPDTMILTHKGLKPITYVTTDDMLWDGVEWVEHQGLLYQGEKDTIQLTDGLFVTTDHLILCGTRWISAGVLARDENILSQALVTGLENLPSPGLKLALLEAFGKFWSNALVAIQSTKLTLTTYLKSRLNVVLTAEKNIRKKSAAKLILIFMQCQRQIIENGCLTVSAVPLAVAIAPKTRAMKITAAEELLLHKNGNSTKALFSYMREQCRAGMTHLLTWIEQITCWGTNQETFGLFLGASTCSTNESDDVRKSPAKLPTYDILCAGPRNRFTVVTSAGPIIAHNCAYGMSGGKLARSLGLSTQWMKIVKEGKRTRWIEVKESEVDSLLSSHNDCIEVAGPEAKDIMRKWEDGAPFIRALFKFTSKVAEERGYIKTILGRRCRFPLGKDGKYGFTHKALNRLAQGSAADQTKQGMLDLWRQGVVPLLSIHDEMIFSVKDEQQARSYAPIMEQAIPLLVPSIVDVNLGKTWGEVEK